MKITRIPTTDPAQVAAATARLAQAFGPLSFIDRTERPATPNQPRRPLPRAA